MLQEVSKFITFIENDTSIRSSITNMSIDDFTKFIKQSGFSFSMDDFVTSMKELDKRTYANNDELSDEDLDKVSAGLMITISEDTFNALLKFFR